MSLTSIRHPCAYVFTHALIVCGLAGLSGCATHRNEQPTVCPDVQCIRQMAMVPHYDACMKHLFRGAIGLRARQAMIEEFGYPFTDASGYFDWRRMGGEGPAPDEWCERYASRKVASPYGLSLSLH